MNVRSFVLKSTFWFNADIFDIAVTSVDAFIEKIRFFSTLILNVDEADLWGIETFAFGSMTVVFIWSGFMQSVDKFIREKF